MGIQHWLAKPVTTTTPSTEHTFWTETKATITTPRDENISTPQLWESVQESSNSCTTSDRSKAAYPQLVLIHKCTKPIIFIFPKAGLHGRYSYPGTASKCSPARRGRVPTTPVPGHLTYRTIRSATPVTRRLVQHRRAPKNVLVVPENVYRRIVTTKEKKKKSRRRVS